MTTLRIDIFPRRTWKGKRWFFRVVGMNGEPVAQSEAYHNRADAVGTAQMMRARLFDAVMRDA